MWNVRASSTALSLKNPYRKHKDETIIPPPDIEKPLLSLALGDPAHFDLVTPPQSLWACPIEDVLQHDSRAIVSSYGMEPCRCAVSKWIGRSAQDVFVTSGSSQALIMAIRALCDAGTNVLIPKPGYPLYKSFCTMLNVEYKEYQLLPDQSWEIDLDQLKSLVDTKTRAIVFCNPSSCGTNYSREHISDFAQMAVDLRIPVISDEVYEKLIIEGPFISMADVEPKIPTLLCSGVSKSFGLCGWRLGWLVVCDVHNIFSDGGVTTAIQQISQTLLGASSIPQVLFKKIVEGVDKDAHQEKLHKILRENARLWQSRLEDCEFLSCEMATGGLFCMVKIHLEKMVFKDEKEWCDALLMQEQVLLLPSSVIGISGFARPILCCPISITEQALTRIIRFCTRNAISSIIY